MEMAQNQWSRAIGGPNFGGTAIYNPEVPCVQPVGNVEQGRVFNISGIPFQNPKRITVNLSSGQERVFHFDIRVDYFNERNSIVRNTLLNNRWGQEERALKGSFPFRADEFFDMIILVESSCFKVAVNNQHVLDFVHRTPFHRIDGLSITGDVRVCQVRF